MACSERKVILDRFGGDIEDRWDVAGKYLVNIEPDGRRGQWTGKGRSDSSRDAG